VTTALRTDLSRTHQPRSITARSLATLLGGVLVLALASISPPGAHAQQPAAPAAPSASAKPAPAAGPGSTTAAKPAPGATRPTWGELTPAQQKSLEPLAGNWSTMHPAQKRKWIAISRNFDSMTPADQEILRSRMTEWATLTAQERTRARLNYAEVKRLAPEEDRKAKWEAYQSLSDEEKRKLAERAGSRPPSAAAPVRPAQVQKFAPVPSATADNQFPPRIQLAPPPAPPARVSPIVPASSVAPVAPPAAAPAPTPVAEEPPAPTVINKPPLEAP